MKHRMATLGSRGAVAAGALIVSTLATACIPYTVGTTARPVATGESSNSLVTYAMPSVGVLDSTRSPRSASNLAADWESRFGIDDRSDVGVRVTSMSGIVMNYKRLLSSTDRRTLVAIMPGAGVVNMGQHGHFEMTLLLSAWEPPPARGPVSSEEAPMLVPYGGLRVMQVVPLAEGAVRDRPTAGGFVGLRIGTLDLGVSPEIGVFYDHSALGVRKNNVVVVPAISVHGDRLINLIRGHGPWSRRIRMIWTR